MFYYCPYILHIYVQPVTAQYGVKTNYLTYTELSVNSEHSVIWKHHLFFAIGIE
jgi:hypothetical protein